MLYPTLNDARLGREDEVEALNATLTAKDEEIAALRAEIRRLKQPQAPRLPSRDLIDALGALEGCAVVPFDFPVGGVS